MRSLPLLLAACLAAPVVADEAHDWTYKDWTLSRSVDDGDSAGQNSCEMSEAQPGTLGLRIAFEYGSGDALPVLALYPLANSGPMAVPDPIASIWQFDDRAGIPVALSAEYVDQVNRFDVPVDQSRALLRGMAAGTALTIRNEAFDRTDISLSGFSAVYRKMVAWCGVSMQGILGS